MFKLGRSNPNCNGVQSLNSILSFPRLLLFSAASSSSLTPSPEIPYSSLANYLVDSLGFTKQEALFTSTKLSQFWGKQRAQKVSDFKFAANADSVINFFKQHGFDQSLIRKVISCEPRFLVSKVDKSLKPKIKILQDMGLYGSDLVQAILANPKFLRTNIEPNVRALRDVLGNDQDVVIIFKRFNWSFSNNTKHLFSNVELLENVYGISRDKINKSILHRPKSFMVKTNVFRDVLVRVEEKLGIPRHSGMFLYGIHILGCFSEKMIESKCQIFKSFGWTQSDIKALIRQSPNFLTSSEARTRRYLDFFMIELGYKPAYLVSHPSLFSYSMEKRILPRHRILLVLKEKGLKKVDYALYNAVCVSETMFFKRFIEPFGNTVHDLHELYVNSRCCPPS